MKQLFAIAVLSIRNAIRSKLVLTLAVILLLVAFFMPRMLKGDGTLSGQVQLTMGYTLGITRFLLAITGIWAGCAAVSSEVAGRQFHMIVTKPVHPFIIWLGKWLGLVILLASLLAISSTAIYWVMKHSISKMAITPEAQQILTEEILVARSPNSFDTTEFEERAITLYDQKKAQNAIPAGMTRQQAINGLVEALVFEHNHIAASNAATWVYNLPRNIPQNHAMHLRYKVAAAGINATAIDGTWTFGRDPTTGAPLQTNVVIPRGKRCSVRVPPEAFTERGFLAVQFANTSPDGHPIIFPPGDGPKLLYRNGSFLANYLRALLVLLIQFAFWTAIGVTAGCLFSMPVAAFSTCVFVLLANISAFLSEVSTEYAFSGGDAEHRIMNIIFGPLYWLLNQVVRPLQSEPVLTMLTQGERINWSIPTTEFLVKTIIYCGILAGLGQLALRRREIGLPLKTQ